MMLSGGESSEIWLLRMRLYMSCSFFFLSLLWPQKTSHLARLTKKRATNTTVVSVVKMWQFHIRALTELVPAVLNCASIECANEIL